MQQKYTLLITSTGSEVASCIIQASNYHRARKGSCSPAFPTMDKNWKLKAK